MSPISVEQAVAQAGHSIQRAASMLWELDENRLRPGVDYTLDLQQAVTHNSTNFATRSLFRFLSPQVWQRKTFGTFRTLLNRYDPRSISVDTVEDEVEFLEAITGTPCIRFVREWLVANGHSQSASMEDFCCLLMGMWFTEHSRRSAAVRTTGFQHVFCGEIKGPNRNRLSGLHNFVRVFLEEQQGNLRYMGYESSRKGMSQSCLAKHPMLKIRFGLYGHEKRISSMFFGVSPEFEVGLYSMIILAGKSEIRAVLGSQSAKLRAVSVGGKVCTAYPELLEGVVGQSRIRKVRRCENAARSTGLGRRRQGEFSMESPSRRPQSRQRGYSTVGSEGIVDGDSGDVDLNASCDGEVEVIDLTPEQSGPRCGSGACGMSAMRAADNGQTPLAEVQSDVIDLTVQGGEQDAQVAVGADPLIDLTTGD